MEQANQSMFKTRKINRGLTTVLATLKLSGEPYELHYRQLDERVLLTSVIIYNACQQMSELGLVTISSDTGDGTEAIYKLTPEGVDVAEKVLISIHRKEQKMVGELDEDEKELLCKLLKKLTMRFDAK